MSILDEIGVATYEDVVAARRLVEASELVSSTRVGDIEAAYALVEQADAWQAWFDAEARWGRQVRSWLEAEARWKAAEVKKNLRPTEPAYVAAMDGWHLLKQAVPNLDGAHIQSFNDLSESLQWRYAAFAAAVLGEVVPPEVKSKKQLRGGE